MLPVTFSTKRPSSFSIDSLLDNKPTPNFISKHHYDVYSTANESQRVSPLFNNSPKLSSQAAATPRTRRSPPLAEVDEACELTQQSRVNFSDCLSVNNSRYNACKPSKTEDRKLINVKESNSKTNRNLQVNVSPIKDFSRSNHHCHPKQSLENTPTKFHPTCKHRTPEHHSPQPQTPLQSSPPSSNQISNFVHQHPSLLSLRPQPIVKIPNYMADKNPLGEPKFEPHQPKKCDPFLVIPKVHPEFSDLCPERPPGHLSRFQPPPTTGHLQVKFSPTYFNPHAIQPFHAMGGLVHPFVPPPPPPQGPCRPDMSYLTWFLSRHGSFMNNRMHTAGSDGAFLFPFRKPKRIRTAFSPSQLLQLEEAFGKNHYVVGQERKDLAASLNLTETQVKVWFQNRRTKHKRVQPGEEGGTDHNEDVMTSDDDDDDVNDDEYVDVDSPLSYSPFNDRDSNHVTDTNSLPANQSLDQS